MCLPGWVGRAVAQVEPVDTAAASVERVVATRGPDDLVETTRRSLERVEAPSKVFDKLTLPILSRLSYHPLNQPTLNPPGFDALNQLTPIKETTR